MARATRTVVAGDLSTRLPGSKLEELDALAKSFNDMAARLKTSFEAMQEAQAELAQVARLTTMGELAGSIAHEISHALRWLLTEMRRSDGWPTLRPAKRGGLVGVGILRAEDIV